MGRIIRDQQKDRLPIIGNIRVGERNDKGYPTSVDYFIPDGDYAESLLKAIGEDKPSTLHITFLSDDDDFSCDERYELWVGKRLYAYGNGEIFHEYNGELDSYVMKSVEKFPEIKEQLLDLAKVSAKGHKHPPEWQTVLKLRFHILEFRDVAGVWNFTTRAEKSSIREIVSSYDMVKKHLGGRIVGIPFDLKVKKVTSNKPGTSHSFPVVSLLATIGTESLDRVRELVDHNVEIRGVINDSKIDAISTQALPDQHTEPLEQITDKTFEDKLKDYNRAVFLLENSPDLVLLNEAVKEIKEFKLAKSEKSQLDDIYKKVKDKIGGQK